MKITVLDAVPLNVGDLSWSELESLGEITLFERTAPSELAARLQSAEILLTNKVKLGRAQLEVAPHLKYIGVLATGFDNIDAAFARERGISVCNVPSYSAQFTAQTTISLLLELCQHVGRHAGAVRAGKWASSRDFSFWETPQRELAGQTLAIMGLGNIGSKVAQIAESLGMRVVAAQLPNRALDSDLGRLPLHNALEIADVVSLHCPLKPETRGLVNEEFLEQMKNSAFLINTGRGALIDENALALALENGTIAGFAGDVLSSEPPAPDNPLLSAPNCLITPHLGWSSLPSRRRCLDIAVGNVAAFLKGEARNLVN